VLLIPNDEYYGDDFQKYRQFRTSIWYEAMRFKHCKKILSNDHAYGFILNTIETRRIELLGIRVWKGMVDEIIFNYTNMWISRNSLNTIFGKARIVEAFYQYFLFDDIKGEMQPSHFNKVVKAAEFAKHVLDESIEKKYDTLWIEGKIPQILKILDLDALISIPLSVPLKGPGIAITPNDFTKAMKHVIKSRKEDFSEVDPENIIDGKSVFDEFKVIKTENKKNEKKIFTQYINNLVDKIYRNNCFADERNLNKQKSSTSIGRPESKLQRYQFTFNYPFDKNITLST
jgi:hypothetical protein